MVNETFFEAKKQQLHRMVEHCLRHVPFYRDAWDFELVAQEAFDYAFFASRVPILEKSDLIRQNQRFIADSFSPDSLFFELTSGTEGTPLLCYKAHEEKLRCSIDLWQRRRAWVRSLTPQDRFARFYAFRGADTDALITNTVLYEGSDIHIPLFDMSPEKLSVYWEKILEFQPRWMHGPSTAIFNIAKYVKEHQLPQGEIEFVELNGEFAPQEHIRLIQEVFSCKVANNYGCREFWTLGYTCPSNTMHIVDSSVFIESIPGPTSDVREILITSLRNTAWPLIRYRIGDVADLFIGEHCSCGTRSRFALGLKRGRRADYFTLRGGQVINAIVFSGLFRGLSILSGQPLIYQYQAVKRSDDLLEMRLCLASRSGLPAEEVIRRYDAELRKIIRDDVTIDYQIVDSIQPDSRTGKCKDFIDLSTEISGGGLEGVLLPSLPTHHLQ